MAKDFTALAGKLRTTLAALVSSDGSQPFKSYYGNGEPDPTSFPCLEMTQVDGSTETRFDSASNLLSMRFQIRGLWSVDNSTGTEDEIYLAQDKVLSALRTIANADDLAGVVDRWSILSIDRVNQTESMPMVGFAINILGEARKMLGT